MAAIFILATGILALAASLFHLGRPWRAPLALLRLTSSWLSREVFLFGLFLVALGIYAVLPVMNLGQPGTDHCRVCSCHNWLAGNHCNGRDLSSSLPTILGSMADYRIFSFGRTVHRISFWLFCRPTIQRALPGDWQ